jgi:hypothetical protein
MKIRQAGADLDHADRLTEGRTDTTKLTVAFRYFANAPKTGSLDLLTHPILFIFMHLCLLEILRNHVLSMFLNIILETDSVVKLHTFYTTSTFLHVVNLRFVD